MTIWGITIKPIIFAAVVIPVIIFGVVVFKQLQNRNFVPINIDQQQIDQRQIEQQKLSTVRDLKGTWRGTASFTISTLNPCSEKTQLTLTINNQTENTINGTWSNTGGRCLLASDNQVFNANLSGTRINNLNLMPALGRYSGSYTEDTVTLNQEAPGQFNGGTINLTVRGPINLIRQ